MIPSKHECLFIRDLSDHTLQIMFDGWWGSMNVASKHHIAWNNSTHQSSWWFYLHCGTEETGSPGIIYIICYQVFHHPSEHGTSSMGKHSLPKAHIAKLNKSTESEVSELTSSTVDETALAILKRQGSRGITIVSLQRKFLFNILLYPYWLKWPTKRSKLPAKDFETSEFHQDMWNCHLILGFVSAHIPWNALSNLELRRSYKALRSELVLPSATILSNICQREHTLTLNAIKKQLPSRNKVSLALDRWTSTNKLAITSVIGYYMARSWALQEVQLTFDEVHYLFSSRFEM